jgi:uncharacterized membrane protein
LFPLKLNKLVNLVCAGERIAVAAQNTETMQAIFDDLSFVVRVERSAVRIELFIVVSLIWFGKFDFVINLHLVTRQDGEIGVISLISIESGPRPSSAWAGPQEDTALGKARIICHLQ